MKRAATEGDDVHHCENCNRPMPGSALVICQECVNRHVPEEFREDKGSRRATDHEGETLFGGEEQSQLRAVHDADLYALERRRGFWVGALVWVPVGAGLVVGLAWIQGVLR